MHEALATEGMSLLPGQTVAYLSVTLADQGHVARTPAPDEGYPDGFGGAEMSGALACDEQGGVTECSIECDGGAFTITRNDGAVLAITTSYLMVGMGQDCGGFTDLAEQPNTPVTYLLHRVDDAVCAQN